MKKTLFKDARIKRCIVPLLLSLTLIAGLIPITVLADEDADDAEYEEMQPDTEYIAVIEGDMAYFTFTAEESGVYQFYSTAEDGADTYCYVYDSEGNYVTEDDDSGDGGNACVMIYIEAGETYIAAFRYYDSSATGSFSVYVSAADCRQLTGGEALTLTVSDTNSSLWYYFIPEESGFYEILACNDEYGTYLNLYDEIRDGLFGAWGGFNGSNEQAQMVYYLEAGEVYIIEAGFMDSDNVTGDITASVNKVSELYDGFEESGTIEAGGRALYYTFTPEKTNYYNLYAAGDCGVCAVIMDADQNWLNEDTDGDNAVIKYLFEAGETYIIVVFFQDGSDTGSLTVSFNGYETEGQCGDYLYWSFDIESGVLTISGSGSMWDFGDDETPWYGLADWIYSIVIEDGVTGIGDYAFDDCRNLDSLTVPSSVSYIGYAVLQGTGIDSITFEGDAPGFSEGAFSNVNAIVYYPADNDTWTEDVKQDYWGEITWAAYDEDGNVVIDEESLYGRCGEDLYWSFDQETGALTITGSGEMWVSTEGYSSWNALKEYITSVSISEECTTIGDFAFANCSGLTSVTIPESVAYIREGAFKNCSNLESVVLPEGLYGIEGYAFYQCCSLSEINLPEGLLSIGGNAFQESGLTSVVLPDSLTDLGGYAFYGCASLTEVTIGSGLTYITDYAFCGTALVDVVIPDTVEHIYNAAFANIHTLKSVTIGENVLDIGDYAFGDSGVWEDEIIAVYTYENSESDDYYSEDRYYSGRTLTVTFMSDAYIDNGEFSGIFGDICFVTIYYYADDSANGWVDFAEGFYSCMDTYETQEIDGVEVAWDNYWNSEMCAIIHANHDTDNYEVTEAATCTEDGTAVYTCSVCGKSWEGTIDAAGHSWDDGVVTKEATETEDGEILYTCTVCGETKTEVIPATGETETEPETETESETETEPETESTSETETTTAASDDDSTSPETGDSFGMMLWIALAAFAIIALACAFGRKRKSI